jgi:hypothetical protein
MMVAESLLRDGLLELGVFQQGDGLEAWRWRLDLLPAYPDVLAQLAEAASERLKGWQIDRLACTPDALPWGAVMAVKTGIPLIYSRGRGETPLYDLVGAYDVGHRACLLTHTLSAADEIQRVIQAGEKTGFSTPYILAIVDDGHWLPDNVDAETLISLADIAALAPNALPPELAKRLMAGVKELP